MTTALLCGATGLVGHACLRLLLDAPAYGRVVVLARRPAPVPDPPPTLDQHIIDFDDLDAHAGAVAADHVFCALGTTIRRAGSRDRFRAVDHDYVVAVARLARRNGARHFSLVSALGADAGSRIFYSRVKGEVEDAVRGLGFPSVTIVRPAVLLGPREEFRLGETLGKAVSYLMPPRLRPVRGAHVAEVMVRLAADESPGCRTVESAEVRSLARRWRRARG